MHGSSQVRSQSVESPRKDLLRYKRMIADIDQRQVNLELKIEEIIKSKDPDLGVEKLKNFFLAENEVLIDYL